MASIAISAAVHYPLVGVALSTITICVYVPRSLSHFLSLSRSHFLCIAAPVGICHTQSVLAHSASQSPFLFTFNVVFASAGIAAASAAAPAAAAAPWPVTLPRLRATHINYCISGVLKMYECSSCYPVV